MANNRMVAVSIGVSDAQPLPYLRGAINGAAGFHAWATALGYESRLITDEKEPVTIARLTSEFGNILGIATPIYRFIVYFAGHGIIREAEDGLWLLSDWRQVLRGVQYEVLKRRLAMFGIQQVSIFADACRSLPTDVLQSDLVGDPVLGSGPIPRPPLPAVDKFIATQDGDTTFAVPGLNEEDDRCLFSGVLLEGLWGLKPNAFSAVRAGNVITSNSLGIYLKSEVPLRAASYESRVIPHVVPSFPEGNDIYFGDGARPTPPVFPPWPTPAKRAGQPLRGPATKRPSAAPPETPTAEAEFEQRMQQQNVRRSFDTDAGFAVDGGSVVAIWMDRRFAAALSLETNATSGEIRVGRQNAGSPGIGLLDLPAPALLELSNGTFVATTALPQFIAGVLVDPTGASAIVYRGISADSGDVATTARVLAQLEGGRLAADDKIRLATELRRGKHADPVLGVISAYLYDSVSDIDSIRRMAYFYVQRHQAIPYDIALLAQLPGIWRDGLLWATVPAVPKRKPRTDAEPKREEWTYAATSEVSGVIGGLWPWMRQGWTFLDHPDDSGSTLVMPGIIELLPRLARARFATLDRQGGQRLAQLFALTRSSLAS